MPVREPVHAVRSDPLTPPICTHALGPSSKLCTIIIRELLSSSCHGADCESSGRYTCAGTVSFCGLSSEEEQQVYHMYPSLIFFLVSRVRNEEVYTSPKARYSSVCDFQTALGRKTCTTLSVKISTVLWSKVSPNGPYISVRVVKTVLKPTNVMIAQGQPTHGKVKFENRKW